ncbi:sugar phosphate isomerase/epimerase [Paenibacillus sp.]|uniref:sugar phosphate isomerase/epimerase family protein n=1 Tax=Paenibacillus sp. TaxID=58172 RepID=UPI0028198A3E|nr:sugar phosphate isomerase/epimerase [Paenibacillus sp.]MDR0271460.1 sugar phosphate isomerase/epimerase [Paenibacillus sp.]
MENVALQLYSIKELMSEDFFWTLKKVADIGYDGVEFAGYFGTAAAQLKTALDEYGLRAAGSHIGMPDLVGRLEEMIEYSLTIASPYIVCPGLPEEFRENADSYKRAAEILDRIGERCKEQGLRFGYHNHGFEFQNHDGLTGLELLASHTQPEHMFLELDTYWAQYAGFRATDWIESFKNRCRILHIKDMKSELDKRNTEIGSGILDFKAITAAGKRCGVEWYTVEQEEYEIPQLESIETSLAFLRQIL